MLCLGWSLIGRPSISSADMLNSQPKWLVFITDDCEGLRGFAVFVLRKEPYGLGLGLGIVEQITPVFAFFFIRQDRAGPIALGFDNLCLRSACARSFSTFDSH